MMEDGGDTNDIQSSPAAEDIDLNDEQREDKSIVSQNSDDSSSMSSKVLNAAASAGKTIVDLSVSAAKATEDTIHKVAASADEVLHSHSHPHSHPHEGEDASSSTSSPSNLKETHEEIKEQQQEEEGGAVQQEPVTTKVLHAASAAGKTVVDLSISAAKMTGDALHKVVESASEVIHKQKSSGEEKEIASTEAAAPADTADDTQNEGNPTQEPVTTKVLHVASAAGKTVVDLSKSAAKLTGEVIHKVVESAGEVLHKDSKSSPGPNDGDSEPQAAPLPLTTEAIEDESAEKSEKVANPPAEESHGGRMWSSVRRMSEKVLSTTSNTISKAAAAVQQQNQQHHHHHHHHQQQQHQSNDEDTKPEADTHNTDASESERSRSGSMTNQLWSSVKKTADTIADSASAAYKAAEPVAISTASKVSHGAQTVWSTTKEKVFPSKKPSSEDSAEGDAQVEGSSTEVKEEEKHTHHQHSSDNPDGAVNENDVAVEVDTKPAYVASAEPQIVSSHVQGVPAVEDVSTTDGHGHGEGEGEKEESSSS